MAKVFLSAGHGGSDPGATAYGMKEKDINLTIMLACKDELVRHGVEVVCSRIKDENDSVGQEVKEANACGATLAVSFHTNAGKGDGSESFYWSTDSKSMHLAELCEKHVKAIGQNSRGVKPGNGLYFINGTHMTAVLCECAFIDNDKDNDIIDTIAEQKMFGIAYAKAILEYLEIPYKENKPTQIAKTQTNKKSIDEIAKEVIAGKWGNGEDRKNRITSAGYNYSEVQSKVNELSGKTQTNKKSIDEIAKEVIAGKWGNGASRKSAIMAAGYNYSEVQKRVNELLK